MKTQEQMRFPVGGPREPVYSFLRQHGFVESHWTDKFWDRADGLHLRLYGSGSMAIISKEQRVIADGPLYKVVKGLSKSF
jgi:hypothetical protein